MQDHSSYNGFLVPCYVKFQQFFCPVHYSSHPIPPPPLLLTWNIFNKVICILVIVHPCSSTNIHRSKGKYCWIRCKATSIFIRLFLPIKIIGSYCLEFHFKSWKDLLFTLLHSLFNDGFLKLCYFIFLTLRNWLFGI